MANPPLIFGLPGSLGTATATQRAFILEEHLTQAIRRPLTVRVYPSYDLLERDLLSGELAGAWSPPLVVARVEAGGGHVAARGIRAGSSSYRSVLVAKKGAGVVLKDGVFLRAAWADPGSLAGCLLPRAHLEGLGVFLSEETHHPSYLEALEAVLTGKAEVSAAWASSADAASPSAGYREILGERAGGLEELGFTRACPNDAIVLSPGVDADAAQRLWGAFLDLGDSPEGSELAYQVFGTDRFVATPSEEYRELGELFGDR